MHLLPWIHAFIHVFTALDSCIHSCIHCTGFMHSLAWIHAFILAFSALDSCIPCPGFMHSSLHSLPWIHAFTALDSCFHSCIHCPGFMHSCMHSLPWIHAFILAFTYSCFAVIHYKINLWFVQKLYKAKFYDNLSSGFTAHKLCDILWLDSFWEQFLEISRVYTWPYMSHAVLDQGRSQRGWGHRLEKV